MPYSFNAVCYPDTASALLAFQQSFPQISATNIYNITTSSISATGLLTFVATSKPVTTATVTTAPSQTLQLKACVNDSLAAFPAQDVLFALAIVIIWALGFKSGLAR